LQSFDPIVRQWFEQNFKTVTEPQRLGWPEIRAGHDVLISAPTGSGKTLSAFLICLDELIQSANAGTLPDETQVLYVSPLKALSNDIHKNLELPLQQMGSPVRAAVRTGDTLTKERLKMTKKPPHILVTTPESMFILLTSESGRKMLKTVKTLIVDEIHAIADDKRGSHLALSIARLEHLTGRKLQKIGLSATVKPIEEVGRFLSDSAKIVNVGHRREMDLAIEVPKDELGAVASTEMWGEIYDRVAELIEQHKTTLVFVNTRRLSERVTHHLAERLGPGAVLPHHGSLSRALRLDAEQKLKKGELRAVVATASLELGIDIGSVDLVVQIGSPRSIAVALQRIGRAGHWIGATPKGRIFATTRDELIECAAVIRAIRGGQLDKLEIPRNALDILAQQIVAASTAGEWREDDLYGLVRSTYSYRSLPRHDFDSIIEMLSDGITTKRGRSGAYLHRDQVNGIVRARRGARLAAITSGGAIPETGNYQVIAEPEGIVVGNLSEDFAIESMAGDIFLLGTTSWRIKRVEPGRVRVADAHGAAPSIPFWLGEAPGRTIELSQEVSALEADLAQDQAGDLLQRAAEQAVEYVKAGQAALGALPSQTTVIAERFFDEGGGMQLVLHAPFGARINRAWGLALRKRFCRNFNFELQAAATDNGIVISLSDQHSFPLEVIFGFLHPDTVEDVLKQALLAAPMFASRWRWNAGRALAILRFQGGRKVPAPVQRMRSDDLLAAVFPDQAACPENLSCEPRIPDHPLVKETIDNCLHEAMDLNGLREILKKIQSGEVRTLAVETVEPSPFSHEILNSNPYAYLDDAPLEERRARAVQLRRSLKTDVADGVGALDPEAIRQVAEESWPDVRNADELHDALLTLILLPPAAEWQPWFDELHAKGRANLHNSMWVATERLSRVDDAVAILRGWLDSTGPARATDLATRLSLTREAVDIALAQLEAEGQILRGHFTPGYSGGEPGDKMEWCNRRILARIHRLTIGRLRREIEPVTTADFMRFLTRWQHVTNAGQLHGVDGTLQVIRQLQGYEIPAHAWESQILARRIAHYEPDLLDRLCLSGEVMWGRLSSHPAFERLEPRRVRPTRVAPVTLFLREDAPWLHTEPASRIVPALTHPARAVLDVIEQRGASFFNELLRATGRLASEVEDGLWELVAAGLVTADGFENLRALVDPKRRRGEGRGKLARPRHAAGRWALLRTGDAAPDPEAFANQLLLRWGVVFRDIVNRETLAPAWRDLLVVLRRMEAKGEIRGGRFVAGFSGEQFARPEAVDLLRVVRRSEKSNETIEISQSDPLNLVGVILPGARSLTAGPVLLHDGVPVEPVLAAAL
jgi:ATP-dependent Lhr-like helicase